ncbi:MAG: arsenic resistance protein [Bacillota bacterium]
MFKRILTLPSRHLALSIPLALALGLIIGLLVRIPQSPALTMPAVLLLVYPIMIGVPWREVLKLEPWRLMLISTLLNFLVIPAVALGLGRWLLADHPALMAGLMIASLLPTSGMTISWTVISGGNVPAAVRITVISLLAGSLLMPFYLLGMLGQAVPVETGPMLARVGMTVILPMILGTITYRLLLKRYTPQQFQNQIKPLLSPISVWAMLYIIFMSTASRAQHLLADPKALASGAATLLLLYGVNFTLSTLAGRWFLDRADAYTLVYTTVLRNLSIALGMALAIFGAQAAFIITLAFILQVQAAAWYDKAAKHFGFFERAVPQPKAVGGND